MDSLAHIPLAMSRRTLFRGAMVASAIVFSGELVSAEQQRRGVIGLKGTVLDTRRSAFKTAKFFNKAWTEEHVASFPVRVGVLKGAEGLRLLLRWDPRLFRVHAPVYLTSGDQISAIAPSSHSDDSLGIELASDVNEIALQVETLTTYPHENLAGVVPTTFELYNAKDALVDRFEADTPSVACAPWSIEVTVSWVCRDEVVVPGLITLTSIGPNPAPAGVRVVAQYADVIERPGLMRVEGRVPSESRAGSEDRKPESYATYDVRSADGVSSLSLATNQKLAPGEEIDLVFATSESNSSPRPFGAVVPNLRIIPPADAVGLRESGRHVSYPVTPSGSQQSTYLPARTA